MYYHSVMARNKIKRFAENLQMPHVIQPTFEEIRINGDYYLKNHWQSFFLSGPGEITLELGCGAGEYSVSLARLNCNRRFIGIDKKGARLWRGAKISMNEGLQNIAFLRFQLHLIDRIFGPRDQISEIWLPFPDPQPGKSRENKRLTHPRFLHLYRLFCLPNTIIHLKTDNTELFDYTLDTAHNQNLQIEEIIKDVHNKIPPNHVLRLITTKYEQMFLNEGKTILYCRFRLFP